VNNGLTTEAESLAYSVVGSLGSTNPTQIISLDLTGTQVSPAAPKVHWWGSTWQAKGWIGEVPPAQVNIDNNLAYLESTRYVPNFAMLVPTQAQIAADYVNYFTSRNQAQFATDAEGAVYPAGMGEAGDRPDLGPYPTEDILWLESGDWRLRQTALDGYADLQGGFPANQIESDPTKRLNLSDSTANPASGLGHILTVTDHDGMWIGRPFTVQGYGCQDDSCLTQVNGGGSTIANAFLGPDDQHLVSPFFIPYILTGDPWYLQEMYNWAAISVTNYNMGGGPCGNTNNNGGARGPCGYYGSFNDSARALAWVLRFRAEAAFAAPDGAPEKLYFTRMTNDPIAAWEGWNHVTDPVFQGTTLYTWGNLVGDSMVGLGQGTPNSLMGQSPPLALLEAAGSTEQIANLSLSYLGPNAASETEPWTHEYLSYAEGRVRELGFSVGAWQAFHTGNMLLGIINSPYPSLVSAYVISAEHAATPCTVTVCDPTSFNSTWTAVAADMNPYYMGLGPITPGANGEILANNFAGDCTNPGGRGWWANPGLAMAVDANLPGANKAWTWWQANCASKESPSGLADDPRWDIVPRTDTNVLPPMPTTE
jgi:hypothetical protein